MHIWLDNFSIFKHSHKFCAAYLQNSYDFEIGGEKCIKICSLTILIWKSFKLLKLFFLYRKLSFQYCIREEILPQTPTSSQKQWAFILFCSRHVILSIRLLCSVLNLFIFFLILALILESSFRTPLVARILQIAYLCNLNSKKINTISYKICIYIS